MKTSLNLVRGAVAKKDIVPVLTHFHVYDGRIQGTNGRLAIDAQCDIELDFTVPAERFLKAVDACDSEPKLKITPGGKLSITRKGFRALLPLTPNENFPKVPPPTHNEHANLEGLLVVLRKLYPFISNDASRMWSNGVMFRDGYAYATNNVVLARIKYPMQDDFLLPVFAIDELLRIGSTPTSIAVGENCIYFSLGDAWIRCQKIDGEWPNVDAMISPSECIELPNDFVKMIEKILPFCPDSKFPRICLNDGKVATDDGTMSAEMDCIEGMQGYYRAEPLLDVARVATHIDFSTYPAPCYFKGTDIEGILVGVLK